MSDAPVWTVGELARKAGVTVRTLHHYDRLGILTPSDYSEAGYRLYGQQALLQLQQILTLKALGLPLEDIHRILTEPGFELMHCLKQQKRALQERLKALQQAVKTLELVESHLTQDKPLQPEILFNMMEVIQMKQSQEWKGQFFTPEQQEAFRIRQAADPGEAERGTQGWIALYREVRQFVGQDPASPEVQAALPGWLARQQALIEAFTQGDPEMAKSLNKLYANLDQAPPQVKQWQEQWADVRTLMEQAQTAAGIKR